MRTHEVLVVLSMLLGTLSLAPAAQAQQAPPSDAFEACPQDTSLISNATIYIPNNIEAASSDSLQTGDQIALFTSEGTCTGIGTWTGDPLAITVYGSDGWSGFDGYDAGALLHFRLRDAATQTSQQVSAAFSSCGGDSLSACQNSGQYVPDALYTLAGLSAAALPAELTSFEATLQQEDVLLTWHTASEVEGARFEIQHAIGEDSFNEEALVDGRGGPEEEQSYTFRIEQPTSGPHRFRLKQTRTGDALPTYSSVVEISVPTTSQPYALSRPAPNPFAQQASLRLTVKQTQNVTVAAYDMLGRQVERLYEGTLSADTPRRFTFEGRTRASGLYFIRVRGEFFQAVRKAMLVR